MKKFIILAVVFVIAAFLAYKLLSSDKKPVVSLPKDQPLAIGKNSGVFNSALDQLLVSYDSLQRALVDWDTLRADRAAYAMAAGADSRPLRQLTVHSSIIL